MAKAPKKEESASGTVDCCSGKAKKDFVISHNGYHREIKAGDELADVPAKFEQNLITEGVLGKGN